MAVFLGHGEKGVLLNPDDAGANVFYSGALSNVGRGKEALERVETALRLNPIPPPFYLSTLGRAYLIEGRIAEAIGAYRQAVERLPDYLPAQLGLILAYMEAGREEEGRAQAHHVLRINTTFSSSSDSWVVRQSDEVLRERIISLFRKAGLPE